MNSKSDHALDIDRTQSRKSGCGCVGYIGLFALIGVLVFLLFPAGGSRRPARRAICTNNLRQIAVALHNYHDKYGVFPPAQTVNGLGKPLHSWRTLILPYLDEKPLYEQVRLDEPWDSPHNKRVAQHNVPIYACPVATQGISYLAVTTTGSVFEGMTSRSMTDIAMADRKQISRVIEITNGPTNWMQPVDFDDRERTISGERANEQSCWRHECGTCRRLGAISQHDSYPPTVSCPFDSRRRRVHFRRDVVTTDGRYFRSALPERSE